MAIDIKELFVQSILKLCLQKPLEHITIKDLLVDTGISRQTFYNHFIDKNDLIHYVYTSKIIPDYSDYTQPIDFYHSLLDSFKRMKEYQHFMKQACLIDGQNCLKDYMFNHCQEFDIAWHEYLYGDPLPEALYFATKYHASASSNMTLSWILSDMRVSCEEMASLITTMRGIGMESLFKDAKIKGNPYQK